MKILLLFCLALSILISGCDNSIITSPESNNNWKYVNAENLYSTGLKTDGSLWAWGTNTGTYGNGTSNESSSRPLQNLIYINWTKVNSGTYHSLGIREDGTLWSWGENQWGQLGNGTNTNSLIPLLINSSTWKDVSVGFLSSYAIRNDGSLWSCGDNGFGELGLGNFLIHDTNVINQIGISTDWESVSAGWHFTVAKKLDGTIWGWGKNFDGQLGNGNKNNSESAPILISSENWKMISAGDAFCLAIKSDGSLWAWGNNLHGQLGDGTNNDKLIPTLISSDSWSYVSAGSNHSLAIKSDGSLWTWGSNNYGKLGDGTYNPTRYEPLKITDSYEWEFVSAGSQHSFGIKNNGSLWTWGRYGWWELGIGEIYDNVRTPTLVP